MSSVWAEFAVVAVLGLVGPAAVTPAVAVAQPLVGDVLAQTFDLPEPEPEPPEVRRAAREILADELFGPASGEGAEVDESGAGGSGSATGGGSGSPSPPPPSPPPAVFGGLGAIGQAVVWLVAALIAALALWALARFLRDRRGRRHRDEDDEDALDVELAEADEPAEPRHDPAGWLVLAEAAEARGDWREGLRCRYRALLVDLDTRRAVDELPGRTSGEYRREVAERVPAGAPSFGVAADLFDRAWYGRLPTGPEERDRFSREADTVQAVVDTEGEQSR